MATMDLRSSTKDKSDLLASFNQLLDEKIAPITKTLEKLNSIENSIDYALEELKKVPILQTQVESLEKEVETTKSQLLQCQTENKNLKESLLKQELYSRNNVKIVGLKDTHKARRPGTNYCECFEWCWSNIATKRCGKGSLRRTKEEETG